MRPVATYDINKDQEKITLLTTRLNTVISKLNTIAQNILQYEYRKSDYILNDKKFKECSYIMNAICQDIDRLLEEEKNLRESLPSLNPLNILKKRRIFLRLEEIDNTVKRKMHQLNELKAEQVKTFIAANVAKNAMGKFRGSDKLYFAIADREYNPLVENLNRLAGTDFEKHDLETITVLKHIIITPKNKLAEEME